MSDQELSESWAKCVQELSSECCHKRDILFFVQPTFDVEGGRIKIGTGLPFTSCCAGGATKIAYNFWRPNLNNPTGFIVTDLTEQSGVQPRKFEKR